MTVTKIDAWIVTCGGTCRTPHGYHLVSRVNKRFGCDCPGFVNRRECKHLGEVRDTLNPPARGVLAGQIAPCEVAGCENVGTVPAGSPLLAWGYRCGAHRAEVVR